MLARNWNIATHLARADQRPCRKEINLLLCGGQERRGSLHVFSSEHGCPCFSKCSLKFRWGCLGSSDNALMSCLESFGGKQYAEETRERSEQIDEGILGGAEWKESECCIQQGFVLPCNSRP